MFSQVMAGLSRTSNSLPSQMLKKKGEIVFITCQLCGPPDCSALFACAPDKSTGQGRKEDG